MWGLASSKILSGKSNLQTVKIRQRYLSPRRDLIHKPPHERHQHIHWHFKWVSSRRCQCTDYMPSGEKMNQKGFGRKWLWLDFILLEGLRQTMKGNLSQDNKSPSRDSNRAPPEYKSIASPMNQSTRH